MTLYGFALFVHVVFAILLVGGSAYAHLTTLLMRRARTVDGIRSHVGWLYALVKASGPIALVVLVAGIYMAFEGEFWGAGWPAVSLVLFALGGFSATVVIDPRVTAIRDRLDEAPDGPVTAELGESLGDRTLTMVSWVLGGADLALVYLMTNKPGWVGSVVTAVIGLGFGAILGARELRMGAPASPPAPTMPAT